MGYIERVDSDRFVYRDERDEIVGDPFSTGWAVKWYGEAVRDLEIGKKMEVSSNHR